MVPVGKDLILVGQVGAARIDQVDTGKPVRPRDFLGAQVFFHGKRIVCAALDGRVVCNDHAFAPRYSTDAGDDSGRRHVLVVNAVCGERR